MSTPSHDNEGHDDPFLDDSLASTAVEIEHVVTVLEPRVRHLNRRLTDVFGAHPSSPNGEWVYIEHRDDGTYGLAFETIAVEHAFRLEEHFDVLARLTNDAGVDPCFSRTRVGDPGAAIVGDAAKLRSVPSVHVRTERRS